MGRRSRAAVRRRCRSDQCCSRAVLRATSFTAKAREQEAIFVGIDGATNAGDDVEAVLASKQSRLPPHVGVSGQREKRATSSTWRV